MLKRIPHPNACVRAIRSRKILAALLPGLMLSAAPALAYEQAPMLDERVESGDLPPVDERLPKNPLVVEPYESIGKYGGVWRSGLRGGNDNGWIARTVGYEGLVRYDREWKKVIPNIAESWEVNDDATEYTFELREGLKWSDGHPFTSEDVAFTVEMFKNPEYPANTWIDAQSNPTSVEVIDDTTFKLVYDKPNGMLMDQLADINGTMIVTIPKHYCSQFNPDYNADANEMAKEEGFQNWTFLMQDKCAWGWETERWTNPDLPTIGAWIVKEPLSGDAARVVWERNPYYFKVDPEGNQLPYIDRLNMRVSESAEELTLMALNGEIDWQDRHINTNANQAVFYDGQEKGGYHLGKEVRATSSTLVFQLNLNHDDPAMRELFQNKDFRIGISHAIDRQEIIDVVFIGQGEPFQVAPRPQSQFYDEKLAKQYTEFDPERAVEHLEAAGLTETNADGVRLMEDGRPVRIVVDVIAALRPEWVDMLELIQLQLAQVGIEIEINNIDRTLFYDKRPGNDYDAQVWSGDGGLDVMQEPRYYFPANEESVWAYKWQAWYTGANPDIAEEPADWAKKQMALYDELKSEGDPDRRAELMKEILTITKENFPVIGVSLMPDGYYIAQNNLKNVAPTMIDAWLFPQPGAYDPAQWYFE
ncbi:ABC transporter substrate-binding protein [Chelativorans salis]|uniref:ABC transporter substrate-binding protein n=1 Tax=Chelativorans salis TaxID=2978478 RepID=A0ABT2LWQ8_9HYPH|nr:ABC transporter substrate-binding protein [Chelativorans sp. EGI FJ00035]MCT7377629.1 ABC transporter substrate-binding protein [Chelativorans sp. EGI FJ00035]